MFSVICVASFTITFFGKRVELKFSELKSGESKTTSIKEIVNGVRIFYGLVHYLTLYMDF